MTISGIGGMTSADAVAYLALQSSDEDKKLHDQTRAADEKLESQENEKELSAMNDKALDSLLGSIGSAAIEAGGAATGALGQNWSKATQDSVAQGFKAADTAFKGVADAMGSFADKDAAAHKINADRAKENADDCKANAGHARQAADQAIDAARSIREAEDQILLISSKRA